MIKEHLHTLFDHYIPVAMNVFRLTRNSDLTLDEEGAEDLLAEIQKELQRRRWGAPVRLEIERGFHPFSLQILKDELEIDDNIIAIDGPIDLSFFMEFSKTLHGLDHLRYPKYQPIYPLEFEEIDDMFSTLRERDVLAFHPYESFEAVDDFIHDAL